MKNNIIKLLTNKHNFLDKTFLNKYIGISYTLWENNYLKTHYVQGFCYKIKKKKYETIILIRHKESGITINMGFILESPNIYKIHLC